MKQKRQRPGGCSGRRAGAGLGGLSPNYSAPHDFREQIAKGTATYFSEHISNLSAPTLLGWATGDCPFCKRKAQLSVDMREGRGGWRCSACGLGGDLIGFHQRLRGLDFKATVRELLSMAKPSTRAQIAGLRSLYGGAANG